MNIYSSKYSNYCPICGSRVTTGELFCEKCGMRIHSHQQQDNHKEFDRLIRQHSILVDIDIDRSAPINIDWSAPINQEQPAHHQHSTLANKNKPLDSIYGMHTLSEMPELKMVVDGYNSSLKASYSDTSDIIEEFRSRTLNSLHDIITGDVRDTEMFESLGTKFIETRDFGLDKCTKAAKEIFNLGLMMNWANLSQQQRMEISGAYAKEVAEAFELVRYNGVVFAFLGKSKGKNNGDGTIWVSNTLLDPNCSPFELIDTITHESRHQYQFEVMDGFHNVPEDVVKEWIIANQIYNQNAPRCYDPWGYNYNPVEIDARYAGETVVRNVTHDLFNTKSVDKKDVIDRQQLRKRLIEEGYSGALVYQTTENLLKLNGKAAEMLHSWMKFGTTPEFDYIEGINSAFLREHHKMKDPAIILSYGLLMNNPSLNSRFLKNLPSDQYRMNVASKANLRSRYVFYDERDYNNAKDALYYGNRTIYDKLYWYGDWGYTNGHDHAWRVDLYDDLTQEELEFAVGHIREHNGRYYKD